MEEHYRIGEWAADGRVPLREEGRRRFSTAEPQPWHEAVEGLLHLPAPPEPPTCRHQGAGGLVRRPAEGVRYPEPRQAEHTAALTSMAEAGSASRPTEHPPGPFRSLINGAAEGHSGHLLLQAAEVLLEEAAGVLSEE